jgi:hypothetical protein
MRKINSLLNPKKKMACSAYYDFDKSDPLWNRIPAMGVEGLINTIDDPDVLRKQLIKSNEERNKMCRPSRSRTTIQTDT